MKTIPPLRRGPSRRHSIAPLVICIAALALPAAWDLAHARNPVQPTLSALHFGAIPSERAAKLVRELESEEPSALRPTPAAHGATGKPTLPSLTITLPPLLR